MRFPIPTRLALLPLLPVLAALAAAGAGAGPALAEGGAWSQAHELAEIRRMIEEQELDWEAGPTEVSFFTPEEKQAMLGHIPPSPERLAKVPVHLQALPERDLPSSWDWRTHGGMTPAKQQGGCGSCWAFAAVGVLEAYHKIETGQQVLFSEQQCLVCNEDGGSCDGGWVGSCYDLWMQFGAVTQANMPYTGNDTAPCTMDGYDVRASIDGSFHVNNIAANLKTAVLQHPIAIPIYASDNMFYYNGGCYSGPSGSINHVVVLCGWDDAACGGVGAWLIKNSWGTSWGGTELGYGWIKYGTCSIGSGGSDGIVYTPFPQALVAYAGHSVLGGDGNGSLDPGETAQLAMTVRNYGIGSASGVSGTLVPLTGGVTVSDDSASFPGLASWATATSDAPHFTVSLSPGVPAGTLLEFELKP